MARSKNRGLKAKNGKQRHILKANNNEDLTFKTIAFFFTGAPKVRTRYNSIFHRPTQLN
jgi:hypothetical protein